METVEQERRSGGNLFHSMGAAKEKERLPSSVRINGTVSRLASEDRRLREGLYGERSSDRYAGLPKCKVLNVRSVILYLMR